MLADRPADGAPSPQAPERIWLGPVDTDDSEWVWNAHPWGDEVAEYVRVSSLRAVERERDQAREALQEINEYARTSYAEGAMRVPAYNGFRDFQWIVNRARRALSPGAATTESEGTHG